jgi:prepilin-type N-terminal cleavage/methylation domain-containing protein
MLFPAWRKNERGFTLIEIVLAVIVISVMVGAMAYIMVLAIDSYSIVVDRREALNEARLAVNMMSGEFQSMADPATDISAITSTSITFTGSTGQLTFTISGNTLVRTDVNGTSLLAGNVAAGSGFQYYTTGGATTSNPSQVYRIGIVLGVNTVGASSGTVVIRSNVFLRNRYYDSFTQS